MDIFESKILYPPYGVSVKSHYRDNFAEVFVAFLPLFRIDNKGVARSSIQRTHEITLDEFNRSQAGVELARSIGEIYSNVNPEYPSDEEILKFAEPVRWSEVVTGADFSNYAEVNKALRTRIGGYRDVFARKDLAKKLLDFAEPRGIFIPTEGTFDVLTKRSILNAFRAIDKMSLVVEDEYEDEKKKVIDISGIGAEEFCKVVEYKDYYIYDADKELLFAIDWDFYSYFICSSRENLKKILALGEFEGFYCDDSTQLPWEHTAEELRIGWQKESNAAANAGTESDWK